jgi:hypothetical protein
MGKGRWQEIRDMGFVLQRMKPAAAQAAEWWQGAVLITFCLFVKSLRKYLLQLQLQPYSGT